jgi:hypothetical protein
MPGVHFRIKAVQEECQEPGSVLLSSAFLCELCGVFFAAFAVKGFEALYKIGEPLTAKNAKENRKGRKEA